MAVTYKDIDELTQKSLLAGNEKIPVSDTNYVTPNQIAVQKRVYLEDEEDMPASPENDTLYLIDGPPPIDIVHLNDASELPAEPDSNTLYVIDGGIDVVFLASESLYPANPDSNTLYLIKEEEE